ncbi:hypothetical protein DFJ74DRAFT_653342 [Hyaloraphidium curvatum]|nr:hypothetical protein DFJ74DRAFT_653342 [Hyaloraphidium curvatum]
MAVRLTSDGFEIAEWLSLDDGKAGAGVLDRTPTEPTLERAQTLVDFPLREGVPDAASSPETLADDGSPPSRRLSDSELSAGESVHSRAFDAPRPAPPTCAPPAAIEPRTRTPRPARPLTPLGPLAQSRDEDGVGGLPALPPLAPDADREAALLALRRTLDAARRVSPPAHIRVLGVPLLGAKSRVETQTKICLQLVLPPGVPPASEAYRHLRIPEHMLASRDRVRRSRAGEDVGGEGVLDLVAEVVCASDPARAVGVCNTCMMRERKRSRKRSSPHPDDPASDDDGESRRILLFNINSLVDFSGDVILPSRITCYCRHHAERTGFCLYFSLRDHLGRTVATGLSPPIMITDDHKSLAKGRARKRPRAEADDLLDDEVQVKPEPPEDAYAFAGFPEPAPSPVPTPPPAVERRRPVVHVLPQGFRTLVDPAAFDGGRVGEAVISKVVPGEGPLHGGIDVTVLGTGFHNGLTVLFGSTPAAATQYWNSNTLVVILPPGTAPGPVVVSFKEQGAQQAAQPADRPVPVFVYKDDSERALMELALQVVGLRLSGRIEDARDVAIRIIGESAGGGAQQPPPGALDLAGLALGRRALSGADLEDLLLRVLSGARHKARYLLTASPAGLSLLHLAVLADMPRLCGWLCGEAGVMLADAACDAVGGWTALMYAAHLGREGCARVLLDAGADAWLCDEGGRSAWEMAEDAGRGGMLGLLADYGAGGQSEWESSDGGSSDDESGSMADESGSDWDGDASSVWGSEADDGAPVAATLVLPIMASAPAPPEGVVPAVLPIPLAADAAGEAPQEAAQPEPPVQEEAEAVRMEAVAGVAAPPRAAAWYAGLASLGSAVQSVDLGEYARLPFANIKNPFRHFEMPASVRGVLRRATAPAGPVEGDEGQGTSAPRPMGMRVFSWVGQSSSHKAAPDTAVAAEAKAAAAELREAGESGEAFTAVVTDEAAAAAQGHDYGSLLWFWLPMAVRGCRLVRGCVARIADSPPRASSSGVAGHASLLQLHGRHRARLCGLREPLPVPPRLGRRRRGARAARARARRGCPHGRAGAAGRRRGGRVAGMGGGDGRVYIRRLGSCFSAEDS